MKIEKIKPWLPLLLVGLPAAWAGLYVWAWLAKVGCGDIRTGECLVSAFANWGGDLVMFHWVDTTLGAGILAVLAATTVIISAAIDRAGRRHDAQVQHLAMMLNTIGQLELTLRRLAHEMVTRARVHRLDILMSEVETLCQQLASDDRAITHHVMFCLSRLKEIAFEDDEMTILRSDNTGRQFAILYAAILSLEDPERHFERFTGRHVTNVRKLTNEEVDRLEPEHLEDDEAERFRDWIDWSTPT